MTTPETEGRPEDGPDDWPAMITALPAPDLAYGRDQVQAHLLTGGPRQAVFFTFPTEVVVPAHSHGAQWGVVVAGHITLTIGGQTRRYAAGDSYFIPAGVEHSAVVEAGCRLIDVFEDPDRYRPVG